MTIDEAIKHCNEVAEEQELSADDKEMYSEMFGEDYKGFEEGCQECAADHRQLAEWLTELKELRNSIGAVKLSNMKEALKLIRAYKAENIAQKKMIAEYKRLLKAAVEDFAAIAEVHAAATPILCPQYGKYMKAIDIRTRKWQYADDALKLLGGEQNDKA